MAQNKQVRSLKSFKDYDEYREWIKDPDHEIGSCEHTYSWKHSYFTEQLEQWRCSKCGEYHPKVDINFPPVDFTGII